MEILGYVAALFIGVTLGLLGGGGSILTIPILVYLFKVEVVTATAYSLFVVGITSVIGVVPKYKANQISFQTALLFGLPSMVSIFLTRKWIVPLIPDILITIDSFVLTKRLFLLGLFALLMIATSFSMIRGRKKLKETKESKHIVLLIAQGLIIGILTGLVGAGGGFLIIPALVLLAGLPMSMATGTSLFIVGINSLVGFAGDMLKVDWLFLISLTSLSIIGIFIGNRLALMFSGENLRKSFGWFTLIIGSWILVKELFLT